MCAPEHVLMRLYPIDKSLVCLLKLYKQAWQIKFYRYDWKLITGNPDKTERYINKDYR